jgi:hypothetical protein
MPSTNGRGPQRAVLYASVAWLQAADVEGPTDDSPVASSRVTSSTSLPVTSG